jgi:hypothetical protein
MTRRDWNIEDLRALREWVRMSDDERISFQDLAEHLQRTPGALRQKLRQIGWSTNSRKAPGKLADYVTRRAA